MISMKRFAAASVIVLAIASAAILTQPAGTTTTTIDADEQTAAGAWVVEQIEQDHPDRVRRALNMCVSLHLGNNGKVNWKKTKQCYENI